MDKQTGLRVNIMYFVRGRREEKRERSSER